MYVSALKTRAFLALADLVIHANDYRSTMADDIQSVHDFDTEGDAEIVAAYHVIKAVALHNNIAFADVRQKSLVTGKHWLDAGDSDINLDILRPLQHTTRQKLLKKPWL